MRGRGRRRGRGSLQRSRGNETGKKGNCGVLSAVSSNHLCQPTLSSHRAQLSRLRDTDAAFHDFLKENDPDLLTFELSEDEAVDGSDVGDDDAISDVDSSDGDNTDEGSDMDVIETPPTSVTSYPEVRQRTVAVGIH